MLDATTPAADPLRISDLVPLRRMLGTDSLVIRVNPDGTFAPFERMPALFFDRSIRLVLSDDLHVHFEAACRQAIERRTSVAFRPPTVGTRDEVLINPIVDNDGDECRFLVCWARHTDVIDAASTQRAWEDLDVDDIVVRYRVSRDGDQTVVEAAPWWDLDDRDALELWPHHKHVSAMGLGHSVIQSLILDATEAAGQLPDAAAVRIEIPSADMLTGLVPVVHAAIRTSGIEAARTVLAIPVEVAVDPDLLPIIVHLRAMGVRIDIVGLDALTTTLHTVSDTSAQAPVRADYTNAEPGPWCDTFADAWATLS